MDRAHRLGQTKQVTVYRLITKDTVDERIVQLARNKKLVQDAVVGSSGAAAPSEGPAKANEVVSLLLNDDELEDSLRQAEERRKRLEETKRVEGKKGALKREETKRQKRAAAAAEQKPAWDMPADDEGVSPPPSCICFICSPLYRLADGFSFFADVNQTAAADDDAEQPAGSGSETPQAPGTPAAAKPNAAPRKRKAEVDENGEPVKKRKRRTKAEMCVLNIFSAATGHSC